MDLKEIGVNIRNWIDSVHVRDYWRTLVNAVLSLQVPKEGHTSTATEQIFLAKVEELVL